MNTFRKTLALVGLLSTASFAQAADSETRDLADFDSIEVGGGIDIVLEQGSDFSVQVSSEEGDLAEIITEVRNGTLYITREWPESWRGWRGREWANNQYSASITPPVL